MTKHKFRIRYAIRWRLDFWIWTVPLGYSSVYYDGWNNLFNLGLFCISWLTPPLLSDDWSVK